MTMVARSRLHMGTVQWQILTAKGCVTRTGLQGIDLLNLPYLDDFVPVAGLLNYRPSAFG